MDNRFYAGNTIFEAFVQDYSRISINLLLALYLVYPQVFVQHRSCLHVQHRTEDPQN